MIDDEKWDALWEWGATQAEVDARTRAHAKITHDLQTAERLIAWRAKYPEATCQDGIALLLAELEAQFAPKTS
jgi:hypothetical protein